MYIVQAYLHIMNDNTVIETSQLNVTKRLPVGLPNIFGFVIATCIFTVICAFRSVSFKRVTDR